MARAMDITYFLICVQVVIGVLNGLGVFNDPVTNAHIVEVNNTITKDYTVSNIGAATTTNTSTTDWFTMLFEFTRDTILFMFTVIGTVAFVYPNLVNIFGIPSIIAGPFQACIYFIYIMFIVQWKSGKGTVIMN